MLPAMRFLVLLAMLAGCSQRNLGSSGGAQDLGGGGSSDLAGADLAAVRDLAAPIDLARLGDLSGNACTLAGGDCAEGDFVPPMCNSGSHEDHAIEMANPNVCGLGICCMPDHPP